MYDQNLVLRIITVKLIVLFAPGDQLLWVTVVNK
ncbi:hypothetical protein predicted by Glimmer/Critica [Lactiplantibacillus plantarum]|nr:hypothetical protein predicted by Glimmer/Critica [Lactiplantibacillus plantarum]